MLFQHLNDTAPSKELVGLESEIDQHLNRSADEKEAQAEVLFRRLAVLAADQLSLKYHR